MTTKTIHKEIEFNRPKKYQVLEVLGRGACGETLRLHDVDMGIDVVVKKYCPVVSKDAEPDQFRELIERFRDEARILFQLNHPNIVRVYNYYDYSASDTSYIIMEYVSGFDIVEYVKRNPVEFETVFEKTISGFEHLERRGVLHRDIRPSNILVSSSGEPKIIDFGFGKRTEADMTVENKSISLNWWCEVPPEFSHSLYDVQTEVYFIGKLFEHIVKEVSLSGTKYAGVIGRMCSPARDVRFQTFNEISQILNRELLVDLDFSEVEIGAYRRFADGLSGVFASIRSDANISKDGSVILDGLETLYQTARLERYLPDTVRLCRIFVSGNFQYFKTKEVEVQLIADFLKLLKSLTGSKREVVIANLYGRLDSIPKMDPALADLDDEIPF
ncbi:MAG: serine/threonine-protein kinase [Hyphomonas sp.]